MPRFCPTCGKLLQFENAEVCPNCGVRIVSSIISAQQKGKESNLVKYIIIGIILCFGFFVVAAVISYITLGSGYFTTPTSSETPTIINSVGKPGWVKYTNYENHFSIYKPSDWTVTSLDKFVYVNTPDMKGFVMLYGMDTSSNPARTQISDEIVDSFIKGLKSSETDQVKIISVVKDSNYYTINGNPARRITVYSQLDGESYNGDWYLITHESFLYAEGYSATTGSLQSDISTEN